ncbi:CDP-6-deoxy-delta-3,4-glucoseen reductase [Curvibacter sp. CHRR-16]|uniref:CDP-6-deoxy-delta-3,4-glucoseen reductase n=1 Tax=Curvibacter sp. CHRR-16 TaxID=2835872 RepID=UPI001BD9BBDE|nr:CDP-6-deoxy-delta-3,4-glucoseen reductase [Curvibacter sp. CHRR-16]MBT0571562.1 CDP-6-deoxy-delta-3,4-glucoseen reductase [Curvibacter sp. CHRR-16]
MTTHTSPWDIHVEPSGRQFQALESETILDAAIRQGIPLPYGCKDGACGSCRCRKLSGEVEHKSYHSNAMSDAQLADGWVLCCRAVALSPVVLESKQVTSADAFPVKKMPTRVASMERLTPDVMRLLLQLPANDSFQYYAGQYIEFLLRDGSRRSYSMANAPSSANQMELHIRHMPGGKFTDHVFGTMKEKEILRMEGPYGSFYLREDSDKPVVLLASGTGFAPIKAILEQLMARPSKRAIALYWGGRRPGDLYMESWIAHAAQQLPTLHYTPVVSNALPEDNWQGRTGWVHQAVLQDLPDLSGHQVYACGAPAMVHAARTDFSAIGQLPESEFYADAFTSEADKALS